MEQILGDQEMEVSGERKGSQRHEPSLTFVLVFPNLIPTMAQTIPHLSISPPLL